MDHLQCLQSCSLKMGAGLSLQVATAARRQTKHASQLEDIIRALVMDTAALSRHTKSLDSQVVGLQNTAERTQVGHAADA